MSVSIIIAFIVFLFLVCKKSIKDRLSKTVIYSYLGVWAIAFITSALRLYGLYAVSDYTMILLMIHVLAFTVGFLAFRIPKDCAVQINMKEIEPQVEKLYNQVWFKVIIIVSTIIMMFFFSMFYTVIAVKDLAEIRGDYYDDALYGPFFGSIKEFVFTPVSLILLPLFAYSSYYKRDWIWLLMGLFLLASMTLSGGRLGYVRMVVMLFFVIVCIFNGIKNKLKFLFISIVTALALFFILAVITASRFGGKFSDNVKDGAEMTLQQMTEYVEMPVGAFNYALENDYLGQMGGYSYGRLTFCSVEAIAYSVLGKVGITVRRYVGDLAPLQQGHLIPIADEEQTWNALYTAVLYYYLDLGVVGVILFPFFFGWLLRFFIKKLYYLRNVSMIIIVATLFYKVLISVLQFGMGSHVELIVLVLLYYFANKANTAYLASKNNFYDLYTKKDVQA